MPFVSAGTLGWATTGYAAARLRSQLHAAIAVAYFVLAAHNVPEHVLTTALGITRDEARRIVAERQRTGGFTSVDEIAARGLLPKAVVRTLRDVLIAIR